MYSTNSELGAHALRRRQPKDARKFRDALRAELPWEDLKSGPNRTLSVLVELSDRGGEITKAQSTIATLIPAYRASKTGHVSRETVNRNLKALKEAGLISVSTALEESNFVGDCSVSSESRGDAVK